MPTVDDLKREAFGHTQYGKQPWRRGEKIKLQGDVDYAPVRRTDPETSRVAAATVDTNALESRVLQALRELGPATIDHVTEHLGLDKVSISPRFRPLANKRLIRDTGRKALSRAGRPSILWQAL